MRYYCVIDTNVLVSALLKESSVPGEIVKLIRDDLIVPLLYDDILNEYSDVLFRNHFDFDIKKIKETIDLLFDKGVYITPTKSNEVFIDKDDAIFYEVVLTKRKEVESYLVTGNIKHFPTRYFVVTPREMLKIIEEDKKKTDN